MKYKIALTFPWEPHGTYWLTTDKPSLTTEESNATAWNTDILDEEFFQSIVRDFGQHTRINLIPVV